jgi:hypothetical protein
MQRLEVGGAVRHIHMSLGGKGLRQNTSKLSKDPENIKIDDDALKKVPKFKYLGSIFTEHGKNTEDTIKRN